MQATHRVAALVSRSPSLAALRPKASTSRVFARTDTPSTLRRTPVSFELVRTVHQTNLLLKAEHSQTHPLKAAPVEPSQPNTQLAQPAAKATKFSPALANGQKPSRAKASAKGQKPVKAKRLPTTSAAVQTTKLPATTSSTTQLASTKASESDLDASKATKTWTEKAKDLWATAKYLFKFYFNGVKQIWANRKLVKAVQERVANGGKLQSRDEFQLLRTHKSDMKKLPLFLFILLILEEALPLVVIWAPSLLPSTCVLPSQLLKIRMRTEVKRAEACQKLRESANVQALLPVINWKNASPSLASAHQGEAAADVLSKLSSEELPQLAKMFSLATWGGTSLVRRRLDTHLAYLREDDKWLTAAVPKGVDSLAKACSERGLRSTDVEPKEMTTALRQWISYTTVVNKTKILSDSSTAMLAVQLYKATSLQSVKSSLEAENQRGLLAKTKDVLKEVVEEEKKVLSRQEAAKGTSSSTSR